MDNGEEKKTPENIALSKQASAGSQQTENPASAGNDGNASTRWCAGSGEFPQTWEVDLGKPYDLIGIKILWEQSQAYGYKIDGSLDQQNWELLVDQRNNTAVAQCSKEAVSGKARYLKITVTNVSGNKWPSLWEFEAYGTEAS